MQITQTPWGLSEKSYPYGEGITFHETASHGGFLVSDPALLGEIPLPWRAYAAKWSGSEAWFEEDCAWCALALIFPDRFGELTVKTAAAVAERFLPKL